ncbi:hypothetical protein NM688_g6142 [Phlebia brevispora]|uniref:Uncharacterized protein n=1 Tax=Phlebia brevispora TaxID=194682 RepID=A0ACC1SJJ7_9APHY|nr:hypothetical protein NM688_g6142 [Phlebia brevispora]
MVVAIALWSLEVQPGSPQTFTVPNDLRITNVALGADVTEEGGRTSLKLTYKAPKPSDSDEDEDDEDDDEDEGQEEPTMTILCSLTPGIIEHALVDLILEEEQEVVFEALGKNTVFLTGNYVDQTPLGHNHDNEDYDSEDEDEDLYGIDGIDGSSSDVDIDEIGGEDDSHRFEEVVEEEEEIIEKQVDEAKLSKAQKKKLNKKLKAENGEAVPAGEEKKAEAKEAEKPKEKKKEKKEKAKKDAGEEVKEKKPEVKELAGGVKIEDRKIGTGPQAKKGDRVSMRYVGKFTNGKQFDANTRGKPFPFRIGQGEVIKGWDVGVAGMRVGGERKLTIPGPMAYGNNPPPGMPRNATLLFEVKLVSIN